MVHSHCARKYRILFHSVLLCNNTFKIVMHIGSTTEQSDDHKYTAV